MSVDVDNHTKIPWNTVEKRSFAKKIKAT